jgi:hypothetical protein
MGWLTDAIQKVRDQNNEPRAKYSDNRVLEYLEDACGVVMGELQTMRDGPNTVRWDLAVEADKWQYRLPPNIQTVYAVFKADDDLEAQWHVEPRGRSSWLSPGILFDDEQISFVPIPRVGETYHVWARTNGEIKLAYGALDAASAADSLILDPPTLGALDPRDMGYAGQTVRVTDANGKVEERHVSTSYTDGVECTLNVAPDLTIDPVGGTYELVPVFGKLYMLAIALQAALLTMRPDVPQGRTLAVERSYLQVMRQLRLNATKLNGYGHFMRGDTWMSRVKTRNPMRR